MKITTEAWIARHDDPLAAAACAEFARRFNRLDPDLGALWAEGGTYATSLRPSTITGRDAISRYFRGWMTGPSRRSIADVGLEPRSGRPCAVMYVRDSDFGAVGLGEVRSIITFDVAPHGRIAASRAASMPPTPQRCRPADLFPGLDAAELHREREFVGRAIPPDAIVRVTRFLLPGLRAELAPYFAAVEAHLAEEGLGGLPTGDAHVMSDRGDHFGVTVAPTIVLHIGSRPVRFIEGHQDPASVARIVRGAVGDDWTPAPRHPSADQTVATYFGALSEEDDALMRIKGDVRRASLRAHVTSEPLATAPAEVRAHDLPEDLRQHLGRMDPAARGGEDLPDLLPGEVEIARVSLTSIHGEVTSLRALDLGDGRLALRLVGEEDVGEYEIDEPVRTRSLTCEEVVRVLASADFGPLEAECGYRLSSYFHPEIAAVAASMGFTGEGE